MNDDIMDLFENSPTRIRPVERSYRLKLEENKKSKSTNSIFNVDLWEQREGGELLQYVDSPSGMEESISMHAADIFAACFRQFVSIEEPSNSKLFQRFMEQLIDSSDFKSLRSSTRGDYMTSQMASVEIIRQLLKLISVRGQSQPNPNQQGQKDQPQQDQEDESQQDQEDESQQDQEDESQQDQEDQSQPNQKGQSQPNSFTDDTSSLLAVKKAIDKANSSVEKYQNFMNSCGFEQGKSSELDKDKLRFAFRKACTNETLRKIMEQAGRYRLAAQSLQKKKVSHGYDDMVGVEMSDNIASMLPVELAKLADEDMELDLMRRLVDKEVMCQKRRDIQKVGRGPIIVTVDESGSMEGKRVITAKSIALALAWIAKHQKRFCILSSFSGTSQFRYLVLPNTGRNDYTNQLINWLTSFFKGDTDFDQVTDNIPRIYEKEALKFRKSVDHIIITDAELDYGLDREKVKMYNKWKAAEKVKTICLVIGSSLIEAKNLDDISDGTYMTDLELGNHAVQKILSI